MSEGSSSFAGDTPAPPVAYRCAECGHHQHLQACALAVTFGPVAEEGAVLATHDDVVDAEFCEDSVICDVHPGALVEKRVAGVWTVWSPCTADGCQGGGVPVSNHAPRGRTRRCEACGGKGGRDVPVSSGGARCGERTEEAR